MAGCALPIPQMNLWICLGCRCMWPFGGFVWMWNCCKSRCMKNAQCWFSLSVDKTNLWQIAGIQAAVRLRILQIRKTKIMMRRTVLDLGLNPSCSDIDIRKPTTFLEMSLTAMTSKFRWSQMALFKSAVNGDFCGSVWQIHSINAKRKHLNWDLRCSVVFEVEQCCTSNCYLRTCVHVAARVLPSEHMHV